MFGNATELNVYFFHLTPKCTLIFPSQPQLQHCPCGDMNDTVSITVTWLSFLGHTLTKDIIVLSFTKILSKGSVKKFLLRSLAEVSAY